MNDLRTGRVRSTAGSRHGLLRVSKAFMLSFTEACVGRARALLADHRGIARLALHLMARPRTHVRERGKADPDWDNFRKGGFRRRAPDARAQAGRSHS
jgi:hypothetical protein